MVKMEENLSLLKVYGDDDFANGAEIDLGGNTKLKENHSSVNGHVLGSSSSSIDSVLIAIGDPEPSPPKFPKEPKKLLVSFGFFQFLIFLFWAFFAFINYNF